MTTPSHSHFKTALALAVAALLGMSVSAANALSLGRITVQSALGEPLLAELEIPGINAEEASSLKSSIAASEAFRSAGLEYNPSLASVQISLQRRPDGRVFLRISSEKTITDPFVDLLLEVKWSSGRIVRDYTLLFDPPKLRPVPSLPASAVQISPPPAISTAAASPVAPRSAAVAMTTPLAAPTQVTPKASSATQHTVQKGESASKIALKVKADKVSLDQMLLALLQVNPDAFVKANIHRLKAGAVLNLPSTEQALATPVPQASEMIRAQSADFNQYRSKLAAEVPGKMGDADARQGTGKVQAQVVETTPASAAADKLTLSKGDSAGQPSEEQIAQSREAKEVAQRAAELSKNVSDLSKLEPASQALKPAPDIAPSQPSGMLRGWLDQPLLPAVAAGLIALLAGLGFYRIRQRNKSTPLDSPFLSPVQSKPERDQAGSPSPGPQAISTQDATDDVDALTEADVYLAYGRDRQAEEILQEALQSQPDRVALHQKLLEIYAKRRDQVQFDNLAATACILTEGTGPIWESICKLGLELDPQHSLYRSGAPERAPLAAKTASNDEHVLKFDLNSISLDLELPQPSDSESDADTALANQLELAETFSALGDHDGARALIEEVLSKATAELKIKAQKALDQLP
ncbi:MAG: FimV/HubP family polar landmark protein [Burkholderiaceae bacterium]